MGSEPSERARATLLDELHDAVGAEAVDEASIDVDGAVRARARSAVAQMGAGALLVGFAGAVALMVGVILVLSFDNWAALGIALAVHGVLTMGAVALSARFIAQVETPDPTTLTRLEADGVADPEAVLNDLVEQVKAGAE